MKPITAAIQAILDADWSQPVTTVEITLRDDPVTPTIVRVADHGVTIGGDVFTPDLVSLPSIIADVTKGLDHVRFQLNNADWAYSVYDNANWLDGASVRIEQYYATNPEYTTFEGPVVAFIGLVTDATPVSDGKIDVVVSSGGGSLIDGNIGRLITGRCMHTYRDAGCGYDHSATVATGGLYTFGNWIPINETAVAGQDGLAMGASSWPGAEKPFNFVQIRRGGSVVYGEFGSLAIADVDLPNKQFSLDSTVTLEIGDKVEYLTCPRDTMETCAARWKVGEATPQQDKFLGFDYHREKYRRVAVPKQGLRALMPDVVGSIVPILYGERAIEPLIFGVHEYAGKHYVVCLMGEGEIGGITDVENDIYFDGAPLRSSQTYNDGVAAKISVAVGTPTQVKITNAPEWDSAVGSTVRGLSAFPNIGHFGLQLPDNYELNPQVSVVDRKIGERMVGSPVGIFNEPIFERTRFWSVTSPDLMVKGVGKEVYTYTLVGGVPTKSGSPSYTRNPIWHVLDLLTAEARTGPSDVFSAGIDPADLLLESFIIWAAYCDDSVSVRDVSRALVSRPRFEASLHITKGVNRRQAIDDLLQSCRGSLVERGGQLGVVLDAPLGGKGSISGATATTLTDDARDGADLPTWPDGGDNGALEGLRVKILTGAGAGQVRFIASNTVDTLTVTAAWDTTPDPADTYAVFSVELNDSNMGRLSLPKAAPTYRLTNSLTVRYEDEEYFGREARKSVV